MDKRERWAKRMCVELGWLKVEANRRADYRGDGSVFIPSVSKRIPGAPATPTADALGELLNYYSRHLTFDVDESGNTSFSRPMVCFLKVETLTPLAQRMYDQLLPQANAEMEVYYAWVEAYLTELSRDVWEGLA